MTAICLLSGLLMAMTAYASVAVASKLTASTRLPMAAFGDAVALSESMALIGAPGDHGAASSSGAVYAFRRHGEHWQEIGKIIADDAAAFDSFGRAVAISGDVALVGANGHDAVGYNSGAAYLFRYDGTSWKQEAKLLPETPSDVHFGWTVALSGDIAVVGAPYGEGGFLSSGAVYIFRHDGASWVQETRLISGSVGGAGLRDLFGWSVAVSGETLVIGAPTAGLAYVLTPRDGFWELTTRLTGEETGGTSQFGYAVATEGSIVAVGAPQADAAGNNAGLAYLFAFDGRHWQSTGKLAPTGLTPGGLFGWAVAMDSGGVVVGAPESEGVDDLEASGAGEFFVSDGMNWTHVARLHAIDAASNDHFGRSVAISHGTLLVGSPGDDDAAGAAYARRFAAPNDPPGAAVDIIEYATSDGRFSTRHLLLTVGIRDEQGQAVPGASVSVRVDRDARPYFTGSGITGAEGTVEFLLRNYPPGCYRTTVVDLNGDTPLTPENVHCKESFMKPPARLPPAGEGGRGVSRRSATVSYAPLYRYENPRHPQCLGNYWKDATAVLEQTVVPASHTR
jgi:hypothetical protein